MEIKAPLRRLEAVIEDWIWLRDLMRDHELIGRRLQRVTIVWNLAEVVVTVTLGIIAGSLALVAFGLDSMIEVFASLVVLWHMGDSTPDQKRTDRARRLVGFAFAVLAIYLVIASLRAFWTNAQPDSSPLAIAYLAITVAVMFTLAAWKKRIGRALDSEPFLAEARMTFLDGWLATAILVALALNGAFGWQWVDAAAALIVGAIAAREAAELLGADESGPPGC